MSVVITTYTLASDLMQQGMNWCQAMLPILLGNVVVLVPMTRGRVAIVERVCRRHLDFVRYLLAGADVDHRGRPRGHQKLEGWSARLSPASFAPRRCGRPVGDPALVDTLYSYAWFVTFAIAFVVYLMLSAMRREPDA